MDVFKTCIPVEKLNKNFIELVNTPGFIPAKSLISDITWDFKDKDGNFIEQFQTTAFDPRLWELFLSELFKELELEDVSKQNRPDFHLDKKGYEVFVEASCTNPANNDEYNDEFVEKSYDQRDKIVEKNLIDYYTIKIGSVLFSKLQKKYWELEWVKGKPLIFAIKPSHNKLANFLPDYKLIEYLYGLSIKTTVNSEGQQVITYETVSEHTHKGKKIPAAFFQQPNAENISAVLFANTCDLQKFNRIGYEGKYRTDKIIMARSGACIKDGKFENFTYQVGEGIRKETWGEGISLFHNPNAKYPLDKNIFSPLRQLWKNEFGQLDEYMPSFFPLTSLTAFLCK